MHWKRWQWLMAKAYLSAIQDAVVSTSRLSPEDVVMRLSVHMNYVDYEIAARGSSDLVYTYGTISTQMMEQIARVADPGDATSETGSYAEDVYPKGNPWSSALAN
jgi:hypothetical protein